MPLNTGTLSMADLQAITNQSVADLGMEPVAAALRADLDAYNALVGQAFRDIAEVTADPLRRVGASGAGEMIVADDFSRAPTQKPAVGGTVGLPMNLFQTAIGWTQRYLRRASPAELATAQLNIQSAHRRALLREMKRAIYAPSNVTVSDLTQRNAIDIPVKRFYNADSWSIPNGPNGEAFTGATHTHYTAESTLTAAGALASINNVNEHGAGQQLQTYINSADEASVSALTGFKAYVDSRLVAGNTDGQPLARLNPANTGNRAIGLLGASEVWVKPWAIANYAVTVAVAGGDKPLGLRTENGQSPALVRVAQNDAFPLIADFYESLFGFGALNRGAGAVHYFGVSGTFAEPSIS